VDRNCIGAVDLIGKAGSRAARKPLTAELAKSYFDLVIGQTNDERRWLTEV